MESIKTIIDQRFKPWWNDLNSTAKFMYVAVSIAGIVAGITMFYFVFTPSYETLYVGLDPSEAGEVVEKLKENKVDYRLENGGTTVAVSRAEIYEVRLKLASEGLPRSGSIGYEIFDKSNLGMTEFLQKINYRRALEGELAKSISKIRGVKGARVHIVIPETRLFKESQKEATASVVITLGGAGGLSGRQVEGIIYLLSASVEGLSPDNVTVLDSAGRLLSAKKYGDDIGSLSSSQLEFRKQVESYLEHKAMSMLEPVVGAGKAVIKISAQLNFEQVEQTVENYDPDNPSIRSEERNQESLTESNAGEDFSGKTIKNTSENVVTNYEINHTVQHVVNSVGNIERLWVAILVDGKYKMVTGKDGEEAKYTPRTKEELDSISGIVKGAIGFDIQRNDIMKIETAPFTRDDVEYSEPFFTNDRIDDWLRIGGKLLMTIIGLMIFLKARKWIGAIMEEQRIIAKRRAAEREMNRKREELLPKIQQEPQLVDHMKEIAKEKPGEIAKVVKTMMSEHVETP
ncbi:MAG: flagellar basal-body MS-ring/collar protein FliF [candidate division Zixibacteria bacterium]